MLCLQIRVSSSFLIWKKHIVLFFCSLCSFSSLLYVLRLPYLFYNSFDFIVFSMSVLCISQHCLLCCISHFVSFMKYTSMYWSLLQFISLVSFSVFCYNCLWLCALSFVFVCTMIKYLSFQFYSLNLGYNARGYSWMIVCYCRTGIISGNFVWHYDFTKALSGFDATLIILALYGADVFSVITNQIPFFGFQ